MKTLPALAFGLWLGAATALTAGTQPTLPQGPPDRPCDQPQEGAESPDANGRAVTATIKGVDRQQGIVELDTKDGRFLMSTAPAEVKDLREGEELLICMEGDDVEGEERLADTPSS